MLNILTKTKTKPTIANRTEREIWYELLLTITKIELALTGSSIPFWLAVYYFVGQSVILFALGILSLNALLCLVRLVMLRGKLGGWLEIATAEAVLGHLLTVSLATAFVGATSGIVSMFFWTPMLVGILGLSIRVITITTIVTTLVMIASLLLQTFNLIKPALDVVNTIPIANIFLWSISLLLVVVGLMVFASRLRAALKEVRRQATESEENNTKLSKVTLAGSKLSVIANSVSAELTATSNQQASGAAEQSQAVVAATTSLEELSYSASQIAENARQVATSIARVLEVAHQVHGVSGQTESIALNGKAAVEATINGFTRTSQRIEVLAHHLLALTERSKKITTIIDLLDEIASETHLLSLNAAIESAGAGTAGQRFSVVAAEIKNLADRSVESTKEVREIIGELQGAVAGAVLAAEEGRKEANRSAEKAHLSGQVIIQVTEAVLETSRFGNMIVEFAENASSLAEEISLATNQQRSASDQIVATIHQVKQVAHETASSCRYIAQSAQQLSDLTLQLSTTLDLNKLEDSRLADQEALVA